MAGIIKRIFIPPKNHILIKADFMAHEIRNWALIAGDEVLEAAFQVGLDARRAYQLLKIVDDAIRQEWKPKFDAVDIHRVNYGFFYKMKPGDVDPKQRQSIKAVVFGVLYGKQAPNLAKELGVSREEAQALIDLLFTKFKIGGNWVKDTIAHGRKHGYIVGPQGRVRHLWGYLHWDKKVHGMMDRRGPNSAIQGVSSDEGYIGGRQLARMVWEYFESRGQPFSLKSRNKVHDSSECTAHIIEAPIATYLLQHAFTTKVHEYYADKLDFPMNIPLELDIGLGGSLNNIHDWDFTTDHFIDITDQSIQWMKSELGYKLNRDKLLRRCEHNAQIIGKVRRKEVKRGDGKMLITAKNVERADFKFAA